MNEVVESETKVAEIEYLMDEYMNDTTILKNEPDSTDFQWANEKGGDAMILMGEQTLVPVDEDDFDVCEILKPSSKKQTEGDGTEKRRFRYRLRLSHMIHSRKKRLMHVSSR
jgi:hypothetical protein